MRPIRLVAQGLTAYHQPVEVDFTELDLFAITGPTGAGKSSLVDAITYALFGKVPRVGNAVKELISQGSDRLKVELEFSTDGGSYRIHRSTARKGQAPVQFERFDDASGEWLGITDKASEATAEIEELLRMDYEAFIRSVLLPQGDFAQFLSGDRDERRKVLDGLLQIGVFTVMGQKANALAARHRDDADAIRKRLEEELADATPDRLREAKADLESLKAEAAQATATREAIEAATATAQKLTEAAEREATAHKSLAEAEAKLKDAQTAAATGKDEEAAHRKTIEALGKQLAANKYDEPAFMRYTRAAQMAVDLAVEERDTAAREKQQAALAKDAATATANAEKAAKAYEAAHEQAEHAQHLYVEARMTNAAAVLQQGLKPGDPCPVCGGKVGKITVGPVAKLDEAKAAADEAKDAEAAARKAAEAANSQRDAASARLEAQAKATLEAAARIEARQKALTEALAGEALTATQIAAKLEALATARDERDALRAKIEAATEALNAVVSRTAEAAGNLKHWTAEVERCGGEAKNARAQIETLGATLRETATATEWDDVVRALNGGTDAAPLLRRRLEQAQLQERATAQAIGSCEQRIKQIDKDIKLAKELTKREQEARETATLARDLASLLRTDAFPTFIRERALQTLATEGSRRLEEISGGRYDLVVDKQDFEIEDRWNGSERRSVKTLSGGETFLASLALALALAEHLPGLGSRGETGALESLFIDEGFSHLDTETLDTVAGALEVLGQDRRRLIGVITHVQALADRMPARITVHKLQSGSTVSVE